MRAPVSSATPLRTAAFRFRTVSGRASFGDALRSCADVWLLSRVLTLGAGSIIAVALGDSVSTPWRIWDSGWFIHIAEHGYSATRGGIFWQAPAFYPLYPGILGLGGAALGGRVLLAGIVLAFPLTLAAFVLLYILARDLGSEPKAARRAVAYLALFPYAFFLQALYSEAAFLVCALAAFAAAERKRFWAAGVMTGAAMLARPAGIAVLAGVVVLAASRRDRRSALSRLSIAPLIFCVFPLVLVLDGRSPVAFLTAEHGWRKYSRLDPLQSLLAPFYSVYDGARAAWAGAAKLVTSSPVSYYSVHDVTAFAVLVVFVVLSGLAWRRLGRPYGVYCAVSLALPLVVRPAATPLLSLQRFALVVFPCFIVLGALPLHRYAHRALLAMSCAGLVGLLYLWTRGGSFIA